MDAFSHKQTRIYTHTQTPANAQTTKLGLTSMDKVVICMKLHLMPVGRLFFMLTR